MKTAYNIYFGGMKHCGKSSHGKKYAEQENLIYEDLDSLMENEYLSSTQSNFSCRDIYKKHGKEFFINLETQALAHWIELHHKKGEKTVLSLGGGIASNPQALELLKKTGYFIFIHQPESVLFPRIKKKGLPPFLQGENPKELFHKLYEERTQIYKTIASLTLAPGDLPKEETFKIISEKISHFLETEKEIK